jgi:GT2 family glycosyltransferase
MLNLSIIIINWNSVDYVERCLASIYKNKPRVKFEIIVVDNASYDGCQNLLAKKFPQTIYIQSVKNLGFSRANNLGFEHSKGDTLLFLNPDTEVIDSSIEDLYRTLHQLPDVGLLGCKLLNSDGTIQTTCIQRFPSILNQVLEFEYLKMKFARFRFSGLQPLYKDMKNTVVVEAITGACMMIKRSIFKKIELFSPKYFMYGEDMDLCYKVKKNGLKVYYFGGAAIIHHDGGSSKRNTNNSFSILLTKASVQKYVENTKGMFYGNLYKLSTITLVVFRLSILSLVYPLRKKINEKDLKYSIHKWKIILNWSFGRENWINHYLSK